MFIGGDSQRRDYIRPGAAPSFEARRLTRLFLRPASAAFRGEPTQRAAIHAVLSRD